MDRCFYPVCIVCQLTYSVGFFFLIIQFLYLSCNSVPFYYRVFSNPCCWLYTPKWIKKCDLRMFKFVWPWLTATSRKLGCYTGYSLFSFLDIVLLRYKVLGICIFAVTIINITSKVFTAKISVFVFQLTTNFKCIVSFITCSLRLFLLVTLNSASAFGARANSACMEPWSSMQLLLTTASTL